MTLRVSKRRQGFLTTRVEEDLERTVRAEAKKNEHTVSAEIRAALLKHYGKKAA